MTDTIDAFRQMKDLLAAGHSQTAWNLFTQVNQEAYDAGYDEGHSDGSGGV